jgi:hypothetical protein
VQIGNVALPPKNEMKCLGTHLDRRLTLAKHIKTKRNKLKLKAKMCTSYSCEDQHSQQKANSSYIKQYLNPSGLMAFSYGGQPQVLTSKSFSASYPRLYSECTLVYEQPQDPSRPTNEHSAQRNKNVESQTLQQFRKEH